MEILDFLTNQTKLLRPAPPDRDCGRPARELTQIQPQPQISTQTPIQAQPQTQPQPSTASRRLPPPCWSHDETVAPIDSYHEKSYSLRRGNMKATHWQDVADSVTRRCSAASPLKTAVQCRHKMEKLRKRYRTELQKALFFHENFSPPFNFFAFHEFYWAFRDVVRAFFFFFFG